MEEGLMRKRQRKNYNHSAEQAQFSSVPLDCTGLFCLNLSSTFYPLLFLSMFLSALSSQICSGKKKMSQAVAADPSALCKLKQRGGFPLSSLVILAMGSDGHPEGKDVGEENAR